MLFCHYGDTTDQIQNSCLKQDTNRCKIIVTQKQMQNSCFSQDMDGCETVVSIRTAKDAERLFQS